MVIKVVTALAQVAILLLAIMLMVSINKKQLFDQEMSSFQSRLEARMNEDRRYYENKINRLQEQLDSFVSSREVRIRIINDRFDNLEKQMKEQKANQTFLMYNNSNSGNQIRHNKDIQQQ